MTDPQFTPDMSFKDYLTYPAMSSSGLRKLIKSPLHYDYEQRFPSESTRPQELGTAVHALVLDGEQVYHVMPPEFKRRAGKAYDAWAASLPDDALILNQKEEAQVLGMAHGIRSNPDARQVLSGLLEAADVEHNVLWDRKGIPCKARLDYVNQDPYGFLEVADIKTTSSGADIQNFGNAIARYDYHMQAAWYMMAAAQEFGVGEEEIFDPKLLDDEWNEVPRHKFYWIVVESSPPWAVAVYECNPQSLVSGRTDCNEMLELYMDCKEKDYWPSYGHDHDGIPMIGVPRWKQR